MMLKSALCYNSQGICVIPIKPHDKAPAVPWTCFQSKRSTTSEIQHWFGNGHAYNIGLVHGEVSGNYLTIDIDKDKGIYESIAAVHVHLTKGRIEQSGSYKGFHIPLRSASLPSFGNKTWTTPLGIVNIRVRGCQTVAPPSIHPNGNRYRFVQKGNVTEISDLSDFMAWLDVLAPKKAAQRTLPPYKPPIQTYGGYTLVDEVKRAWPSVLGVFAEFGHTNTKQEQKGETRVLGNGGLHVNEDDTKWYAFADGIGGSVIEAWGYCQNGSYDRDKDFKAVLLEMAKAGGVDLAQFHNVKQRIESQTEPTYWTEKYQGMWERVR